MIIEVIDKLTETINREIEDGIMSEVKTTIRYNINKDELMEAITKGTAQEVKVKVYRAGYMNYTEYHCPNCIKKIESQHNYCPYCGQKLDWEGGLE